jgi:hypothetical protein
MRVGALRGGFLYGGRRERANNLQLKPRLSQRRREVKDSLLVQTGTVLHFAEASVEVNLEPCDLCMELGH